MTIHLQPSRTMLSALSMRAAASAARRILPMSMRAASTYSSDPLPAEVTFKEFEEYRTLEKSLIIDVREPEELEKVGKVPGAVNCPLGDVAAAFDKSAEDFQRTYGREKPDIEDQIVALCAVGIRSAKALGILSGMGYTNLSNYRGSFNDWHENTEKLH